ncbi:four helix bundle protein [Pinibacter aurantiacus]|uniref:Four helix bundle protein n=1 Tax=Pinibacter aurantiacus TaxID=2851599 RepID=A0A9E2S6Y2_9BACT|nr:four helix bundle protein [Pinibacter aurantiacus]MBV4355554.1 four helix bundle protein [Pinibacter aurantiacus]
MKQDNVILDKTFSFSIRIIKLFQYLKTKKTDKELIGQLLRSGTSIGANTEEAIGGSSRKDFVHKLKIAYREARETRYWLKLLLATDIVEERIGNSLIKDCEELLKILTAIINKNDTN